MMATPTSPLPSNGASRRSTGVGDYGWRGPTPRDNCCTIRSACVDVVEIAERLPRCRAVVLPQ